MALLDNIKSLSYRIAKEIREGTFDLNSVRQIFTAVPTPAVPDKTVAALKQNVDQLTGATGSVLDKAVTLRDLIEAGAFTVETGTTTLGSGTPTVLIPAAGAGSITVVTDSTVPILASAPTPSGLTTAGMVKAVFMEWDLPLYANPGGTQIWRSTTNAIGTAAQIGESSGTMYIDTTAVAGTTYYYWVRAFLSTGETGSYNAVSGTAGGTTLAGSIDLSDLAITAAKLASGAVTAPKLAADSIAVGTAAIQTGAIATAMIADAAIASAKIATAAVQTAKIADANVTTAKVADAAITSAKIVDAAIGTAKIADAAITSAKIADASITSAKITDATITTAKIADASITDAKIGSTIQSTTYTAGSVGWKIDKSGAITAYSGSGDRQFDLAATGTTPVLKIGSAFSILGNGSATFAGALSAATGTFSGTLTAAAVDAVSTINIAGDAVIVPRRGEYYTAGAWLFSGSLTAFTLPSISFPVAGRVVLFIRWSILPANSMDSYGGFRIKANGTTIYDTGVIDAQGTSLVADGGVVTPMFTLEHSPGAGTWTYTCEFYVSGSQQTAQSYCEATLFAIKK